MHCKAAPAQTVEPTPLDVCLLNARSCKNKTTSLLDYTIDHDLDMFCITETWLGPADRDQVSIGNMCPNGYSFIHTPRSSGRGGGVGMLYKSSLNIKQVTRSCQPSTFESMEYTLTSESTCYRIILVYRPPPKQAATTKSFMEEFADMLDELVYSGGRLVVMGDFNFHVDCSGNAEASRFLDLVDSYNLSQ